MRQAFPLGWLRCAALRRELLSFQNLSLSRGDQRGEVEPGRSSARLRRFGDAAQSLAVRRSAGAVVEPLEHVEHLDRASERLGCALIELQDLAAFARDAVGVERDEGSKKTPAAQQGDLLRIPLGLLRAGQGAFGGFVESRSCVFSACSSDAPKSLVRWPSARVEQGILTISARWLSSSFSKRASRP